MEDGQRQLIVVRHGERCDFVFNRPGKKSWVRRAFDSSGRYMPFDINLPRNVPRRKDGWINFEKDAPLTEMGYLQSKLIGRSMRDNGVKITHVYCSAALRCIQTTVGILKGLGLGRSVEMNVEPGLYEWMQWCRGVRPAFMVADDLVRIGYPINTEYKPFYQEADLLLDESLSQYYERSHSLVNEILNSHPEGIILIVGHSASLEVCSRQLCGRDIRTNQDFFTIIKNTPYLSSVRLVEYPRSGWEVASSPVPPLSHSSNLSFDAALLTMPSDQLRTYEKDHNILY